jgi:hypothetical protein
MVKVADADTKDTAKYLDTSDKRFNADGAFGKLDQYYQADRVTAWASGTTIDSGATSATWTSGNAAQNHTRA